MAIMDTCEFNRLRKIQQLGLCSRVFKDATHNRFSHSVGVSHLAGKFATQLNEHLKRERVNDKIIASDRDIRCVQIAGLCHDLGHAPFSHVFEKVLRKIGVPLGEGSGEWNHEEMGVRMLQYLMEKNNIHFEDYDHVGEEDMLFIRECIVGVENHIRSERNINDSWPRPSWLYDIVSNHESGLDVDKLDYLMRDSSFTHVKVGADFNYLLTSARVRCCDDGTYRIAFPDKAYMEVLKVFQCRYDLHQAVYQHRTVVGLEDLLVDAITAAAPHALFYNENDQPLTLKEAVWDCHAFSSMTDTLWDQIVHERRPELRKHYATARYLFQRIDRREKYPYAGEVYLGAEPELQKRIYDKGDIVLNHAGEKKKNRYWSDDDDDDDDDNEDKDDKLTEEMLKQELVDIDTTNELSVEKIIVHFKQAHYGQKIRNPNNEVYFFPKETEYAHVFSSSSSSSRQSSQQGRTPKTPNQPAQKLNDEKYSLPRFCDRVIRVYCRDEKYLHVLQNALRKWTKENGCPSPRGGSQSQVM
jgi:HD superfamily phosphohydrolase